MGGQTREGRCTRSPHHQLEAGLRWKPTSSSFSSLKSFHWPSFVGLIELALSSICLWADFPWVLRNHVIPHREWSDQSLPLQPADTCAVLPRSTATAVVLRLWRYIQLNIPLTSCPTPWRIMLPHARRLCFLALAMRSFDCCSRPQDYKLSESRSSFSVFVFSAFFVPLHKWGSGP